MKQSGRAAIRERSIRLLYERGEMSEEELIQTATIVGDHKKARAVIRDMEEAEQIVRTSEGLLKLSDEMGEQTSLLVALEDVRLGGEAAEG